MHQTIKKVSDDIENFKYNTAISAIMEFVNFLKDKGTTRESLTILCQLIAPFTPHIAEELWHSALDKKDSVHLSPWPKYSSKYLKLHKITIIIQIDGKMRSQIATDDKKSQEEIQALALSDKKVQKWINAKKYKVIYVPGKIINFVLSH